MQRFEIEKILQSNKEFLADQYNVSKIGLFGSYSREENTETSDIDILVHFSKPIGLFKF